MVEEDGAWSVVEGMSSAGEAWEEFLEVSEDVADVEDFSSSKLRPAINNISKCMWVSKTRAYYHAHCASGLYTSANIHTHTHIHIPRLLLLWARVRTSSSSYSVAKEWNNEISY